MKNLRKTQLALAMIFAAGFMTGCQNTSTRAEAEEAEVVTTETQTETEYSLSEDYPSLEPSRDQYSANQSSEPLSDETLLFAFDSADLSDDAKEVLDDLISALDGRESVQTITIRGYADATGPEEYNEQLSQRRAESVRNYLRDKGIQADNWNVEAFGEENPVASNDDERGRRENRRVVVEFSAGNEGLSSSYSPE
jgi:outer membrane protein OmpA-like peptidoglycan-associated protein